MALALRRPAARPVASGAITMARLAGAGLLGASGAIHLDLYLTSYGHIPTIGPLFLAQAVAALCLAVVVAAGLRPQALVSTAGALLALATLGGYVLALLVPLFGFREVRTTAGVAAAVVEVAAVAALGTVAAATSGLLVPWTRAAGPAAAAAGALAVSLALAFGGAPPSGGAVVVRALRVGRFGAVLASRTGRTYYLLSTETHGRLVCNGPCLSIWPPVLVRGGERPAAGPGVAGHLGTVRRPGGEVQVTYNGYPLYGYAGDAGPGGTSGQGIASFGGVWYLVRAGARTPGATAAR